MGGRKIALVTGGNRGIGYAICDGLHNAGLDVVLASREKEAGARAASSIGCRHIQLDLKSPDAFEATLHATGPLDVLVNNAGVLFSHKVLDSPGDFQDSMTVMLESPYHLIRLLTPGMTDRNYGRIVNISSDWGSFAAGLHGPGAYGVAKAALNALTLALSREVAPCIKVNSMCPGWVRTRMGGDGANLSPEEGADTAVWLAQLPEDGPTGGFFRDRQPLDW